VNTSLLPSLLGVNTFGINIEDSPITSIVTEYVAGGHVLPSDTTKVAVKVSISVYV